MGYKTYYSLMALRKIFPDLSLIICNQVVPYCTLLVHILITQKRSAATYSVTKTLTTWINIAQQQLLLWIDHEYYKPNHAQKTQPFPLSCIPGFIGLYSKQSAKQNRLTNFLKVVINLLVSITNIINITNKSCNIIESKRLAFGLLFLVVRTFFASNN